MNKTPKKPNKTYLPEMAIVSSVAFELGFIMAIPVILFGSLGRWLDARYETSYFVLLGIALALFSSSIWVYKRLSGMIERLNKAVKQDKQDIKDNHEIK